MYLEAPPVARAAITMPASVVARQTLLAQVAAAAAAVQVDLVVQAIPEARAVPVLSGTLHMARGPAAVVGRVI